MPTEKTPLTGPSTSFGSTPPAVPFYVQDTHRFYSRRRRERQLQCIMFVTIIATLILALIVTISYSASHPELLPQKSTDQSTDQSTWQSTGPGTAARPQERSTGLGTAAGPPEGLSDEERRQARQAGDEAVAARRLADSRARPLARASAPWRHQLAVSTSPRADAIALVGLAELAATRRVERARLLRGRASSFGAPFEAGRSAGLCAARCPARAPRYRRIDGACNQPQQRGMAYSAYRRALPPDYADGVGAPRRARAGGALPSARAVSLGVRAPSSDANPAFSVMLAVFGQFLDHDITATALSRGANGSSLSCCPESESSHPECFPVRVGPGDPVHDLAGRSCMEFVRSAPAAQCKIGPRQQLNQVTAFIDGSTIYGSEPETAAGLRELAGGRLRMQLSPDRRPLLPASRDPDDGCNREAERTRGRYCFSAGDARANENLHLTTMHLLWARQHNLLAGRLAALNPRWGDERLYQEARRLVGAQLQHVAYAEFLPIVLGESEVRRRRLRPLAGGFRAAAVGPPPDPTVANHFAAAAFRFAHTLLPGLMEVSDERSAGSSYVQLHKMLFNPYSLYSPGGLESAIRSAASNAIRRTSTHASSQLTEHLFEGPAANGSVPCGLDLVSLNIQRGRDHGLPGYVHWRQYCALSRPSSFDGLSADMDPEALAAIFKLYEHVDDVDLYTGALAELNRGDGLLGPTFTCLIADQFQRLQAADRYWYETAAQPGSFTEDQLAEIRKTTLARIICDTSDGITQVQPEVMRSIGPNNPMTSCQDIAQVSLQAWKTEIPPLAMADTVVPAFDWLEFKADLNKTIGDIIGSIAAKKPPAGSLPEDWLSFQKDINATFTDLRNRFATLQPKVTTNMSLTRNLTEVGPSTFDWMGLRDDVSKTVSEIMDSITANKPASGSLPADWLAYRKKINDSLLDVKKKFNVIHPKPTLTKSISDSVKLPGDIPTIDWLAIRNQINATIMDVVKSINSTKPLPGSTPADWLAFREKVNDSLIVIKNKFAGFHPEPIAPAEKLGKAIDHPTFDWIQFKNQLNETLSMIVASTISKKPPAGITSTDWLKLQKQMNNSFGQFVHQFPDLHPKELDQTNIPRQINNSSEALADKPDQVVENNNVNKTVAEIVAEINANKPAPGSSQEDWLAFQQKMNDAFAGMQSKNASTYEKNKTKTKPKLTAANPATMDMMAFKDDLNKTLIRLLDLIKSKRPAINSSMADWLAYKKEVRASVSQLKKDISVFRTKDISEGNSTEYAAEDGLVFDWMGWKTQINNSIDRLLVDIQTIPSGDPNWASFRDYLNGTFSGLKNKLASMRTTLSQSKLMRVMKEDWLSFKDQVNSTIEDALDDLVSNQPTPADSAKKKETNKNKPIVNNQLVEMLENLKVIQTEWLKKAKAVTDTMTVTDVRLSATSSASTQDVKFNFYAIIIIVRMRSAFL